MASTYFAMNRPASCPALCRTTTVCSLHPRRRHRHHRPAHLRDLLDAGHDIEDNNGDGWTLLRHAIDSEYDAHAQSGQALHADLTSFLLARGADPSGSTTASRPRSKPELADTGRQQRS